MLGKKLIGHPERGIRYHLVDVPARLDHGDTLRKGHDGTTLAGGRGVVGQHTDYQPVTMAARLPEELYVADVEQVSHHVDVHPRCGSSTHAWVSTTIHLLLHRPWSRSLTVLPDGAG